ncbi:hypothetical protein H4582DRAFT_1936404 [Lactarius indigo]|nr:hypothetical protein H4582DRAFT_1936404 [Lactarius indigo]
MLRLFTWLFTGLGLWATCVSQLQWVSLRLVCIFDMYPENINGSKRRRRKRTLRIKKEYLLKNLRCIAHRVVPLFDSC